MPSPFIGPTYALASRPASVQRTVNLIPVPVEPGNERAPWTLKDAPGLTSFSQIEPVPPTYTGLLNHFDVADGLGGIVSEIGPNVTHSDYLTSTPAPKFGAQQGGLAASALHSGGPAIGNAAQSWRAEGFFYPTNGQDDLFSFSTGIYSFGLARYNIFGDSAFLASFTNTLATGGGRFYSSSYVATLNAWNHVGVQFNGTTGQFDVFINGHLVDAGASPASGGFSTTNFAHTPGMWGSGSTFSFSIGSATASPDEFYFRNIKDSDLYVNGYPVPTKPWSTITYPAGGGTIRGLWTHGGGLNTVEDASIWAIDSVGQKTYLGTMNSIAGNVDFASNLTQFVVNDGSYLYPVTPISKNMQTVFYAGGDRISFLDQRIIRLRRGTQVFEWSGLADATSWDPLNIASAESSPDPLIAQVASQTEIILFGTDSTQTYRGNPDQTDESQAFVNTFAAIDYGCVAAFSAQKTSNSVIWVSQDQRGQAMVLSLVGHQAKRISDRGIEEKFQGIELSQATAFTYSDGAHSFYCLNVPGLDTTLVWDETFQQWHERAEWIAGKYQKWSPTCHAFAYGRHFFGCGTTLATLDPTNHTYLGNPKRRQRIAPVTSAPSRNRLLFSEFEMVCERGYGGTAILRYSQDNGANWSRERYMSLGAMGQYGARAKTNRLGTGYDWVLDVSVTEPVPWNPVEANLVFG